MRKYTSWRNRNECPKTPQELLDEIIRREVNREAKRIIDQHNRTKENEEEENARTNRTETNRAEHPQKGF